MLMPTGTRVRGVVSLAGLSLLLISCSSSEPGNNGVNTPGAGTSAGGGRAAAGAGGGLGGSGATAGSSGNATMGGSATTSGGTSGGASGATGMSGSTAAGSDSAAGTSGTTNSGAGGTDAGGTAGAAGMGAAAGAGGMDMGAGGMGAGGMAGMSAGGMAGMDSGAFSLISPNHEEGTEFADKYTCAEAGFNGSVMPALEWTAGPPGTMSYAITFIDITLAHGMPPNDNGYHWVVYDIPADVHALPEEFKDAAAVGAQQNGEFLGPCPNFAGGNANTDTYEFRIYALASETLTLNPTTGTGAVKDAEAKLEADNLAVAVLSGTSSAAPP